MKNMKKRLISLLLTVVIIFSMTSPASAAKTYSASAALAYAKAHWDDGIGECAAFVSACLKAGGCEQKYLSNGATTMARLLKTSPYGTWLELAFETDGNIKVSKNSDKLSAGDPVFYNCPTCNKDTTNGKLTPHPFV